MISPTIKYRISPWLALLLALWLVLPANAQGSRTARVELATVDGDGVLVVHVAVPRGQTVEAATLTVNGNTVNLQPEPAPLAAERWILLDSGETVVNTATTTQAALQRFLQTTGADNRTGLVIYAQRPTLYFPTDSYSELQLLLDDYNARVSEPGCLGDALAALAAEGRPLDRARRVLVIAGPLSRQGLCTNESYTPVSAPVDQLIITEDADNLYLDIQERSGGELFRANIRTIEARLNDVSALWAQPSYRLDGTLNVPGGAAELRGDLTITLANNTRETFAVTVSVTAGATDPNAGLTVLGGPPTATPISPTTVAAAPTAAAPADAANTANERGASVPANTPVPTQVPPTATLEAAGLPNTGAPTAPPTTAPAVTVQAIANTTDADAAVSPTAPPPTTAPTQADAATEAPATETEAESGAVAVALTEAPPTAVAQAEPGGNGDAPAGEAGATGFVDTTLQTLQGTDPILLVGVGLVVLGVIGGLLFLLVLRRPETLNTVTGSFATSGTAATGQQTYIEPMQTTIAPAGTLDDPHGMAGGPRGPRTTPLPTADPNVMQTMIEPAFGDPQGAPTTQPPAAPTTPPKPDTFDIYNLYEPEALAKTPDDEVDLTEMVSDADLMMGQGFDDEDDKTEIVTEDELLASRPLIGYLQVVGATDRYELRPPQVTLGRHADNDIVLDDGKKISRHHLRFEVSGDGRVEVHVLTNNAVVHNGESVYTASFVLAAHDQIRLTPSLLLEFEPAEPDII